MDLYDLLVILVVLLLNLAIGLPFIALWVIGALIVTRALRGEKPTWPYGGTRRGQV